MRAVTTFRLVLIHATANLNLILGGLALAFGVYILVAGADAMAAMVQVGDAGAGALAKVAPTDDAKKAGDMIALASEGVGAFLLAMASIVAGCAIAQGLPFVLVGLGILLRQGWARVFGILFGVFGLMQGLACLTGSAGARSVQISGAVFAAYGLLSLIGLIGGSASAYFARREPETDGASEPPPSNGKWALAGILASTLVVALSAGLAINSLPGPGNRAPSANSADAAKLHGVWEIAGPDAHRLAFAQDGSLYYAADKGSSKGTYKIAKADSLDIEYDLPDAIFQAQQIAFDLAKKAADNPDNPFKGLFNAIEPIRTVKDRVRFTLADGNKSLTLHHAKTPARYKRSDVNLVDIEKQYDERQRVLAKLPIEANKDKKVSVGTLPKLAPKDEAERLYRERLAGLHDTIAKGQTTRMKAIIQGGVGVNDRDDKGETPLMKAVQAGYIDIVKELITLGGDWTITDREENDLLVHAMTIGRFEWLVSNLGATGTSKTYANLITNSQVNWESHIFQGKTTKKATGLMVAAASGQLADLQFVYTISTQSRAGDSSAINRALMQQDRDGKTALDYAQAKGHVKIVAWLEEVTSTKSAVAPPVKKKSKDDVPTKTSDKFTVSTDPAQLAFLKACSTGDLDAADAGIRASGDKASLLQARDASGKTPLILVAERGDITMMLLVAKTVRDTNSYSRLQDADAKDQTAYHHAAERGDVETLKLLCAPLMTAWGSYSTHHVHWFKVLELTDANGKCALERAEAKDHKDAVKFLQEQYKTAFVTRGVVDGTAYFPLEVACVNGDLPLVKHLLRKGCPVDKHAQATPLMHAAQRGHIVIVQTLLDTFGKDDEARLKYINFVAPGKNTAYRSAGTGQPEVQALLRKYGAKE